MEHSNGDTREITLEPAGDGGSRRSGALWGVLAAVAVIAGILVVSSSGGDGTGGPGLPVSLGARGIEQTAGAADSSMPAWVSYVPGDSLPALGGEAPAYRLAGTASAAQVRQLAAAVGLDGDPVGAEGRWSVTGDAGTLEVGAAEWWFGAGVAEREYGGGGSDGSPACGTANGDDIVDCDLPATTTPNQECTASDGPAECLTGECPPDGPCAIAGEECGPGAACVDPAEPSGACPGAAPGDDTACLPPDDPAAADPPPEEPPAPADLPSEDAARAIALDLLAATGLDVDDALVTVDGPADAWYLSVEPRLGGVPSGLVAQVAVGPAGAILHASGHLGAPERLGDYPLLDTRGAIERANAQSGSALEDTPLPLPADDPATSCAIGGAAEECGDRLDGPVVTAVEPECKQQEDGAEICETNGCVNTSEPGAMDDVYICRTDGASSICPHTTGVTANDGLAVGAPYPLECTPPPPDTTIVLDPAPAPPPAGPIEVVLVAAEPALMVLPAVDGTTDLYLVPSYRFTDENGGRVDLPGVTDEALTTPDTTVAETTVPDTTLPPNPDPDPCEQDQSGTAASCPPPQGERIELMLHCVNIVDWQGLWWSTDAINAPDGWVGKGTIVQEPDGTATYVDDGAPDEPTTFVAQGPADEYPPCA